MTSSVVFMHYDGLNSLNYSVVDVSERKLFTRILIDLTGPRSIEQVREYFNDHLQQLRNKTGIKRATLDF